MAPKGKSKSEVFRTIASGLRTAAVRPNISRYEPHDKQLIFHSSTAKIKLFLGGNRSGKTVGGATESIMWLTGKHPYRETPPPPVRGRCVSVDFLNGVNKIVKPEVARWIPPSELKNGSWEDSYNKEERTLTLSNGSFLEFMSSDQDLDKHAGTSRHFIWFDEEPPHDIYLENKARLIDTGGSMWFTMTPVDGMTWIYDDIYLAGRVNPNILIVEIDMEENPHISQTEIDEFTSGLSKDEIKARKQGKFVQIGGLVYKQFGEAHIIKPIIPPADWLHLAMMDHGYNNQTAWLWAGVDGDGRFVVYDEHVEAGKVIEYHAGVYHRKNEEHKRIPDYNVGDPSIAQHNGITGTSVQLEYIDYGIVIVPGNNEQVAGINRVARYMDNIMGDGLPQLLITENCPILIHQLSRLRWSTWATKKMQNDKNRKEEQHKKDDHSPDALRYGIASRPLHDDGKDIPEKYIPDGVATPVDPYNRRDEGLSVVGRPSQYDPHLGDDW